MPVYTKHPDYIANSEEWKVVRDAIAGQRAIKKAGRKYLPAAFADDDSKRYAQYIERAYYQNVTGRTQGALLGLAFRVLPKFDLPAAMIGIKENADGSGHSLYQLAKKSVGDVLATGRYGFLADYPRAEQADSLAAEIAMGLRATVTGYSAEDIINWRTVPADGGGQILTLVVLKEDIAYQGRDEFEQKTGSVYRVLRLRPEGYTQELRNSKDEVVEAERLVTVAGRRPMMHIPFHFAGALDNFPNPDKAPLADIAWLNISHYQSTAELKENEFFSAQGTVHLDIGTMGVDEFNKANPGGVKIGVRSGIVTSGGGRISLVQGDSRQSHILSTMDREERQMVSIGARLSGAGRPNETAEAARIHAAADTATLGGIVENVSEAMEAALEDAARFHGSDTGEVSVLFDRDFWATGITAQQLQAIIGGIGKAYAVEDALEMIRTGKIHIRETRENSDIIEDAALDALDQGID